MWGFDYNICMDISFFPKEPTLAGAYAGEFSTHHLGASSETTCCTAIGHELLGRLESIPGLGLLIALVEFVIAKMFYLLKDCCCPDRDPVPAPIPLPAPVLIPVPAPEDPVPPIINYDIPLDPIPDLLPDGVIPKTPLSGLPQVILKLVREYLPEFDEFDCVTYRYSLQEDTSCFRNKLNERVHLPSLADRKLLGMSLFNEDGVACYTLELSGQLENTSWQDMEILSAMIRHLPPPIKRIIIKLNALPDEIQLRMLADCMLYEGFPEVVEFHLDMSLYLRIDQPFLETLSCLITNLPPSARVFIKAKCLTKNIAEILSDFASRLSNDNNRFFLELSGSYLNINSAE